MGQRYPTDLTEAEWTVLAPRIPTAKLGGRPRTTVSVNSFLDTLGPKIMRHQLRHSVAHVSPGQGLGIHAVQSARSHYIDAETRAVPGEALPRYQKF